MSEFYILSTFPCLEAILRKYKASLLIRYNLQGVFWSPVKPMQGSMYIRSGLGEFNWTEALNTIVLYKGKIARTGTLTSNGHISATVALREKLIPQLVFNFGSGKVVHQICKGRNPSKPPLKSPRKSFSQIPQKPWGGWVMGGFTHLGNLSQFFFGGGETFPFDQ